MIKPETKAIQGERYYVMPDPAGIKRRDTCNLCALDYRRDNCEEIGQECGELNVHYIPATPEALEAYKVQVIAMRLKS